jgi:hypothetical protein
MNKKIVYILIAAVFLMKSCSVFTEEDIDTEEVFLLAPANDVTTSISSLTFWWDPVPDATGYTLQIVSPDFENAVLLVLDTNITQTSFQYSLNPGLYEWGVIAYNSSSATDLFYHSLKVDTASTLSNQTVLLKSPAEEGAVNTNNVSFSWYALSIANNYMLEIKENNWNGEDIVPVVTTENNEYVVNLDEGTYAWGVMARNDFSATPFSVRTLVVDVTPPATPEWVAPAESDSVFTLPYTFSWSHPETSLSEIQDQFMVSTTENFSASGIEVDEMIDTTYYELTDLSTGTYYFRLKSIDNAGNQSAYTAVRSFRIDEE